jgi:hypothetical protein
MLYTRILFVENAIDIEGVFFILDDVRALFEDIDDSFFDDDFDKEFERFATQKCLHLLIFFGLFPKIKC